MKNVVLVGLVLAVAWLYWQGRRQALPFLPRLPAGKCCSQCPCPDDERPTPRPWLPWRSDEAEWGLPHSQADSDGNVPDDAADGRLYDMAGQRVLNNHGGW